MTRSTIALLMLTLASSIFAAEARWCRPLHGRIAVTFTTENCTSPLGLCTKGEITGDPILRGKTFYTALAAGPTTVDPTAQAVMNFSGALTVTTKHGVLTIPDVGLLDRTNGLVSEQSRSVSGTGHFAGVTGFIFITANSTQTGFTGSITGRLCHADVL
jgi:hypothetical protein